MAAPLINATGRLFIPFESSATTTAAVPFANQLAFTASACSPANPTRCNPACCNASTITKSPATNGKTDQDTPFATLSGMLRFLHVTTAIANNAATQVGTPSGSPKADDEISATAAIANPTSASFPSVESTARS